MPIYYKSTAAIVLAVRAAKMNPHARFSVPGHFPLTAEEVLANFRAGVMRRCNRGLDIGNDQRFHDAQHDARIINDAAKRIRWPGRNLLRNRHLVARYPHIHNPPPLD